MKRLLQSVKDGRLHLVVHPDPMVSPTTIHVAVEASLISSGTERSARRLARSSLLRKAKERPDLVRAVVDRARQDGIRSTVSAVQSRLEEEMPVGYSASGVVTAVGEAVQGIRPGDRVTTSGTGHASMQFVPGNLVARLPDGVSFDEGAFGAVASVALHGIRLADAGPGSRVIVIGLGLVGQLAVRLALASGCDVAGTDLDEAKLKIAADAGAYVFSSGDEGVAAAMDWTQGRGGDAVLVAAATKSSDPMRVAASLARDRATIVAVGDVGLDLDRRPLYDKELTVKVSRAYGPGRYDPTYEDLAVDYPIGFVRWPIGRNLDAVMGLIARDRLTVTDLITHRFPFDRAVEAYDVFDSGNPYLGILLEYERDSEQETRISLARRPLTAVEGPSGLASGLVGAGRFASDVLLPSARAAGFGPWTRIISGGGASAIRVGERGGFDEAVSEVGSVVQSEDTDVVFVASRHDSHAEIVEEALLAGKHVFCEKPLAISEDELCNVAAALGLSSGVLMVGFNRRWSPVVQEAVAFVGQHTPMHITYRVHAGALPDGHWLKDRRQGGRLLGEGCHFIDTCNAIAGEAPRTVYAIGSGEGEVSLQEDFTVTLGYPSGSQAVITYSAGAPSGAGKERVEVMRGDRAAEIDDFRVLTLRSATTTGIKKYKPADKGHLSEFVAFRAAIKGGRDEEDLARSAMETSRVALAAIESLMTGQAIRLDWSW